MGTILDVVNVAENMLQVHLSIYKAKYLKISDKTDIRPVIKLH